ncbi:ABC transporter substrate binding protein [Candidatus Cyrtobacter comes]|uniref:ABC transporter substrate binding protein n=1 Tax=Candidatus Cyrtobacter comes TaxID=675776 RepID=A0ABU5L9F1_9RICK|nr:ABC transporter substrate binding protein [Candidatus Cyrtobacter comes]
MCAFLKRLFAFRRTLLVVSVLFLLLILSFLIKESHQDVIVLQYAEHPALDQVRRGISDYMEKCCSSYSIMYESAQADPTLASQLAQKIYAKNPKLVVTIGTLAAQAFLKKEEMNVIFSSITDPVAAGLAKSFEEPGMHFTGVSNFPDIEQELSMIELVIPNVKRIGLLYNTGEVNSNSIATRLKDIAAQRWLEIVEVTANSTKDMISAVKSLAGKVDVIYITNDNTALSALQGITRASNEAGIPVFCSDTDTIGMGIVAAFGPDQYGIGVQTAKMIEKFLESDCISCDIPKTPIQISGSFKLKIDKRIARKLGIEIRPEALSIAGEVIE